MHVSINSHSNLLPPILLVLATCELHSVQINQQKDGPIDPLLTLSDGTTVSGFKNVVIELVNKAEKYRHLSGANDADRKEVEKWLELCPSIQPNDPKTWTHQLHKYNRTLLLQVFVVSNYLSIADIAFYATLHPIVSAWSEKERNIDGSVTRWFDFIQNQSFVPKLLPRVEIKQDALLDERKPSSKPETTTTTSTTSTTTTTTTTTIATTTIATETVILGENGSKPSENKKQEAGKNEKKQPSDKKEKGEAKGEKKQGNEKKEQGEAKGEKKQAEKGDKKEKKPQEPKKAPEPKAKQTREGPPDVSWLEIRVGKILECSRHPDPAVKSLYVEQIDVGEPQPRTVVSGLVDFIPIDVMKGHRVALLCNLKPAKLRGVLSMAMVLAASSEDHKQVELVTPPEDAQVGERLYVEGFSGDFEKEIEKDALLEIIQGLHTDDSTPPRATYKGSPILSSAGPCSVSSIKNGGIK